nr:hypothetical protein [Tanacetum cinerariifolium]
MVTDLRYFNSFESEVDSLRSQLETQKTQSLNEIDRLSREYYYADHMNAILGVFTELDEVTNLQCDYLELLEKCEGLETELSKSKMMSKSFESVQKHAINLELELQQCKEKIKNDMLFKVNKSKDFCKEREQYFEIQDLKAQLQDKCIVIICLMAKATSSQAWLWHRRLSHLNLDTINLLSKNDIVVGLPKLKFIKDHLCSSCELGKTKRKSFQSKIPQAQKDGYNFYIWTYVVPCGGLHAQVRIVRTDKGTEFLNKTLYAYFASEGILHQTPVARTHEQNSVAERRNRTLVEAARTMLSTAKVSLFFWAEAIATTCFT